MKTILLVIAAALCCATRLFAPPPPATVSISLGVAGMAESFLNVTIVRPPEHRIFVGESTGGASIWRTFSPGGRDRSVYMTFERPMPASSSWAQWMADVRAGASGIRRTVYLTNTPSSGSPIIMSYASSLPFKHEIIGTNGVAMERLYLYWNSTSRL